MKEILEQVNDGWMNRLIDELMDKKEKRQMKGGFDGWMSGCMDI